MYCLPCAPVDHQLLGVSYTLAFRAVSFLYFDALFKLCHPFIFTISYMIIKKKWTFLLFSKIRLQLLLWSSNYENELKRDWKSFQSQMNDKFYSFISIWSLAQLLSSFGGSFWQNRSFKNSISFSSKILTEKRIGRLVPFF